MSNSRTATKLAAMKADAKQRARASGTSYNAMLELVARENGFESWYAALHNPKSAAAPLQDEPDLIIDPVLPPDFHNTPNEDRDDEDLQRWWLKPFATIQADGKYVVQCLDGGAWDRPTYYGTAVDLEAARQLARTKLANWREVLDRPTLTLEDENSVALTVDSLDPRLPRAVLARFPNHDAARVWLDGWTVLLKTEPDLVRTKLARAREHAVQAVPTQAQMAEQYAVLSRIATLMEKSGYCEAPDPLRADIQQCVDHGFVLAQKKESLSPPRPRPAVWSLALSDTGKELLQLFEDHLRETDQK